MMIKHEVKLLQPSSPEFVDLWEFRSMPPDPQTRLLGYLGAKGCFIGLWFGMRRDLGEMGDVRWSNAAKKCEERFLELFPTSTPLKAAWPIAGRQGLSGYFDE